jgi:transposase
VPTDTLSRQVNLLQKNEQIKSSIKATREKRKRQLCRVFRLKVDKSKLSKQAFHHLKQLFLQAKWFSNAILASEDVFAFDSKVKTVPVKVGQQIEQRNLTVLSSQMKQALLKQIQRDIQNLAKKRAKGYKVGRLKFKKCVQTIPLKQYNNTYTIHRRNQVKIQGLGRRIKVRGLQQIPEDADYANANLIWKHDDFFLHVTTYIEKKKQNVPRTSLGIDFGIKHQLTLSNGLSINYNITIPPKLRAQYKKLSRKRLGSKNYVKEQLKLQKSFSVWNNRKKDVINKIAHVLTTSYQVICYQKDPIKNWCRLWGSEILNTTIGALLKALEKKALTPCPVNQWAATTKHCHKCGTIRKESLELSERTFRCSNCSLIIDRDYNAAKSIEKLGLLENNRFHLINELGAERIEVTPRETNTPTQTNAELINRLNQIPFVRASAVCE